MAMDGSNDQTISQFRKKFQDAILQIKQTETY